MNRTGLVILSGAWVLMWACAVQPIGIEADEDVGRPVDDMVEANGAPASRRAGGQANLPGNSAAEGDPR